MDLQSIFLPPELWDLILQKLLEIDANEVAQSRLLSEYFNLLIMNNKNIKYNLYFAEKGVLYGKLSEKIGQACEDGHIEIIKWIVSTPDVIAGSEWCYDIFRYSCTYGQISILQWLHSTFNLTSGPDFARISDVQNELITAVANGHLEVVLWLLNTFSFSSIEIFKEYRGSFFSKACRKGYLDVAKWLADITTITTEDITFSNNVVLCNVCWDKYGEFYSLKISDNSRLETLKWLIENFKLSETDIKARDNRVFKYACRGGKLNIIKWLLNRFPSIKKDFEKRVDYILKHACQDGHSGGAGESSEARLDVVKWAVETFNITDEGIEYCCIDAFGYACMYGHLEIVKWLSDNFNSIPRSVLRSYYLRQTCKKGHLDVLKFILESLNQEDRKWPIETLKTACSYNHLELSKWIVNRFNLTKNEINDQDYEALKNACERKHLNVVEWLIKNYY